MMRCLPIRWVALLISLCWTAQVSADLQQEMDAMFGTMNNPVVTVPNLLKIKDLVNGSGASSYQDVQVYECDIRHQEREDERYDQMKLKL